MAKSSGSTRQGGGGSGGNIQARQEAIFNGYINTYSIIAQQEADKILGRTNPPAVNRWLGDAPKQVEDTLNGIIEKLKSISKVSDIRDFEKQMRRDIDTLRFDLANQEYTMENNKDFVSGRAKSTAQQAINEIGQLKYLVEDFRRNVGNNSLLANIEQWLINNNRW